MWNSYGNEILANCFITLVVVGGAVKLKNNNMKKPEQLEFGETGPQRKFMKKLAKRNRRRKAKKLDEPNPKKTQYYGWSF